MIISIIYDASLKNSNDTGNWNPSKNSFSNIFRKLLISHIEMRSFPLKPEKNIENHKLLRYNP